MNENIFTRSIFFLLFFGLTAFSAEAQQVKFGKISEEELMMKTYEQDTSAAAVILSDYGNAYFIFSDGFKVIFERQTRIKILKKSGYDWANVSVPVFSRGSKGEKLTSVKGFTYNLVGGKVVKEKIDSKSMFDEKVNEYVTAKKFTLPNVKEGSVIEYSYTITSDYIYNMREWEFQSSIPTAWSEFNVKIPQYFVYKKLMQGYLSFHEVKNTTERAPFNNRNTTGAPDEQIDFEVLGWTVKDAPAMREEKFITTVRDYVSKIEFELEVFKPPFQIQQVMTGNWNDITKELVDEPNFGQQLNRSAYFKDDVAAITANFTAPTERLAAIYNLVKGKMKWNNRYGIYTSGPLRKAFENRTGSAAEINLMLTAMLRDAGFNASPVILSTREHGRIVTGYSPMLNKFNYVIAHVTLDGKEYLLDATDPLLPVNMLPVRCLNGVGRLINQDDQRWISLNSATNYSKLVTTNVTINEEGEIKGQGVESASGYNALYLRKSIKNEGLEKFAELRTKEAGNFKIGKPVFGNVENINAALSVTYDVSVKGNDQSNDIIYVNPLMGNGEKENPFKLQERLYPVDFATPIDHTYITKITIPAGYEVEEMPKGIAVSLPDDSGRFTFMLQKEGNQIQVMSKLSINKPVFFAEEYPYLKEFYNHVVAKHAEKIVLKKTSSN